MDWKTNRRKVIAGLAGLAGAMAMSPAAHADTQPTRAIAFDGFPIFDPRGVVARARTLLGPVGDQLAIQWSAKLFGYSWLVTAAGRYQDFRTLADAALRYVAATMGVQLDAATRIALVDAYDNLDLWPDVVPALEKLRGAGVRLAFLSNLGENTLNTNMARNKITQFFEPPLSTDRVARFKPAPEAYAMAISAFGMPRETIGFAAFGGWDAAGASWFGYRTAWINRMNLPIEPLDVRPEIVSSGMEGVLALAGLSGSR
ncbi:haloacid dehalogenase type II [Beijerinckia mobilis]|uniref:haloacid dehalogenase type II n=1 Tax=Beijerinckia mobilis TaxID=231434 RepID=UPI0005521791|nr:haloacid dehalogenase type II [Beijerinckia mobilis]